MYHTIDCHMHVLEGRPQEVEARAAELGYAQYTVLSCPCMELLLNNLECLWLKVRNPGRVFAFGGFTYPVQGEGFDSAGQLRMLLDAGFDGLKLLETKPGLMKKIGIPMDGQALAPAFEIAWREALPILWHVGDPANFWDPAAAPAFAVENGWCYDDTFPSLCSLYAQAEGVLERHPGLKVCFAHLYFCGDNPAHLRRLLDAHPGVRLDVTPGSEMYGFFLRDPALWRAFFLRYADRILYGTDLYDARSPEDLEVADHLQRLIHGTLRSDQEVAVWDLRGKGLGLPPEVLQKIYAGNFARFAGPEPRIVRREGAQALYQWTAALLRGRGEKELLRRAEQLWREMEPLLAD